jgi:hypothetical protein
MNMKGETVHVYRINTSVADFIRVWNFLTLLLKEFRSDRSSANNNNDDNVFHN